MEIDDIINDSLNTQMFPEPEPKKNKGGGGPGGARPNAGRKSKTDEQDLINRIRNIIDDDEPLQMLKTLIQKGDMNALKLYMSYRWGIPKEKIDITTNGKDFNIPVIKFFSNDSDK